MSQYRLHRTITVGADPEPSGLAGAWTCKETSDFRPAGNIASSVSVYVVCLDAGGNRLPSATADVCVWEWDVTPERWVKRTSIDSLLCLKSEHVRTLGPVWVQLLRTSAGVTSVQVYLMDMHNPETGTVTVATGPVPLGTAITSPLSTYGEVLAVNSTPVVQSTFALGAGLADIYVSELAGTGSVAYANSMVEVSTGGGVGAYAYLSTRRLLKERAGQGKLARFSAIFDTPAAGIQQLVGMFTAANGFAFGYTGTDFGIHHLNGGVYEIRTLTITAASAHVENVTVQLNGVNYPVAVTNAGGVKTVTANEIAAGSYGGVWTAYSMAPAAADPYVVFLAVSPSPRAGAYSLTGTSAAGTFALTCAGVSPTYTFIPQSAWNVDRFDGTGHSGVTLLPEKGNVYAIATQYLGFGGITFFIEEAASTTFLPVHRLPWSNANTRPNVGNPTLPLSFLSLSYGGAVNRTIRSASLAGFVQGGIRYLGPKRGITAIKALGGGASYVPVLSLRNPRVFAGKATFSEVLLQQLSISCDGTKSTDFLLLRNAVLANPVWQDINTAQSILQTDTQATGYTNGVEQYSLTLAKVDRWTGDLANLELFLRPGEIWTFLARSTNASDVHVTACTVEDV